MRIAIISGGKNKSKISSESADNIFLDLQPHADKVLSIKINDKGEWSQNGIKITPHSSLIHVDHILDITHDTHNQSTKDFIKKLGVRHVLSEEHNHEFLRGLARQLGIDFPKYHVIKNKTDIISEVHKKWREMHMPIYVRGASNKVLTIDTHNPEELYRHILHIHDKNHDVIIDEKVKGKKYSLVSIANFRGQDIYTTPIIEKMTTNRKLFLSAKSLSEDQKTEINNLAKKIHMTTGGLLLKHDFVMAKNGPVLVNVETRPAYTKSSSFYDMLSSSGINFMEILKSFK